MLRKVFTFAAVGSMLIGMIGAATAQEKHAKDYITEASPYLYLSCEGLMATFGKDKKKIDEIIQLMVAVSFINREIDATKFLPEKTDQKAFGEFLEKALTAQCKNDVHSLMITNVDHAVVYAFDAEASK